MFTECITLSFHANFSPFSLAKSPPHNLQIIAYIMVCLNAQCYPTVFGCKLYSAHVWMKPRFLLLVITLAWKWQIASLTFQRVICDRTIIKTINSVITKYRDLSVSQISWYFAQPCPNCQLFTESGISQMLYNMIIFWVKLFVFSKHFHWTKPILTVNRLCQVWKVFHNLKNPLERNSATPTYNRIS